LENVFGFSAMGRRGSKFFELANIFSLGRTEWAVQPLLSPKTSAQSPAEAKNVHFMLGWVGAMDRLRVNHFGGHV
jgi:hypothetical protein